MIDVIAQLPPAIEALTGLKLQELISKIPELAKKAAEQKRTEKPA